MINTKKLHNQDIVYYEVYEVSNYNEFLEWLYKLEEEEMSLAFNGSFYRFRNPDERIQFVFGFQAALSTKEI